jgi:hypothetical protein
MKTRKRGKPTCTLYFSLTAGSSGLGTVSAASSAMCASATASLMRWGVFQTTSGQEDPIVNKNMQRTYCELYGARPRPQMISMQHKSRCTIRRAAADALDELCRVSTAPLLLLFGEL